MLIINNKFLSLYDYNFLLVIEKIRKRNAKICGSFMQKARKCPAKIEWFLEDLFLGSQWSIILGYRQLSVKSLTIALNLNEILQIIVF